MTLRPCRSGGSASQAALRLLQRRDHGKGELRRKLRLRGFPEDEIERVLESLDGRGLLDDASYARAFAKESLASGHGPAWISAKLRSRGVAAVAFGIALDEETASLRALLKKRRVTEAALTDPAERAKIVRFARGRGYRVAAMACVFRDLASDEDGWI